MRRTTARRIFVAKGLVFLCLAIYSVGKQCTDNIHDVRRLHRLGNPGVLERMHFRLQLALFRFRGKHTYGYPDILGRFFQFLDESSGIYNLRYFEMRLNEEFDRARRYNIPLTLLLVEIDEFKKTNSSYGRIMGEKVFGGICKLLKENFRTSDIMARYGGDQLIMMLPSTALFSARKAAEKYRAVIEDKVLDVADEERDVISVRLNYTISIGVSVLQNDVKRAGELIRRADIALYKAKDRGRNRVAIYGE